MSFKIKDTEITTKLTISFTAAGVVTYQQADSTPELRVYYGGALEFRTQPTGIVLNPTPGVYTHSWTPDKAGAYLLTWYFTINGVSYTQSENIFVLENATATSTAGDEPDISLERVCRITGTFLDSGGNYRKGVQVRFSPSYDPHGRVGSEFVVDDITSETDANGLLDMFIVRGLEGLLTITGVGLSRRVKIPDQATINIFDLTSLGLDTFEVQTPEYYEAPRRS